METLPKPKTRVKYLNSHSALKKIPEPHPLLQWGILGYSLMESRYLIIVMEYHGILIPILFVVAQGILLVDLLAP
jgi:hypothetical protein